MTRVQSLNVLQDSWFGTKSGNWLLIDVSVTNIGKKPITVSDSDFTLISGDGAEYETDSDGMKYFDDSFFLENVNPKMSIKGHVLFAVPAGFSAEKAILEFTDSFWSSPTKIDLHR